MSTETEQDLLTDVDDIDTEIKNLSEKRSRKMIALEEIRSKPKLRHGDYGVFNNNRKRAPHLHLCYNGDMRPVDGGEAFMEQTSKPECYDIHGNIFDLLKQGPILVALTVEEAEYINSCNWIGVNGKSSLAKRKAALAKYKENQ